jgi:Na+-transporting NADH:ubiquinone oxidoreductase subunit D
VLLVVGAVRELTGSGKFFNISVFPLVSDGGWYTGNGLMSMAPSAFFLIGLFIWILRTIHPDQVEEE